LHWNHPQVLDLGPRQGIAPNYLASRRITDDKSRLCDDVPDLDIEIVTVDQLACLHVDSDQFASLVFTHIQSSSHYGYLYLSPAQCLVGLIGFLADFNACSLMLLNAQVFIEWPIIIMMRIAPIADAAMIMGLFILSDHKSINGSREVQMLKCSC
jgi:hypothetical protein